MKLIRRGRPIRGGQAAALAASIKSSPVKGRWPNLVRPVGLLTLLAALLASFSASSPVSAASPTISLSQSTNTVNINVPTGGGIGTNGHTLNVTSNSITGYNLTVSASTNDTNATSLINTKDSTKLIKPITASTTNNGNDPVALANNTWGYNLASGTTTAVTDQNKSTAIWKPITPLSTPATLASSTTASGTNHDGTAADSYFITYGANVSKETNNGNTTMAASGAYITTVQYTATAQLPPAATIASVSPNEYTLGSGAKDITITGTNFSSASKTWIDAGICEIKSVTDTQIVCTINIDANAAPGKQDLYIQTQADQDGRLNDAIELKSASPYIESKDGNITVQLDKNMIPVKWTGRKWQTVTNDELANNGTNHAWYNYGSKMWANAITVSDPTAYDRTKNEDLKSGVLGYWVWIPRYEYKVMSVDGTTPKADNFDINFQTANEKTPVFNSVFANSYATHPAFDWDGTPLAGFWMGKFETTGTKDTPTVLPDASSLRNMYIGDQYTTAKSIGTEDTLDTYGGFTDDNSLSHNSHHLAKLSSHMLKNSEWGAVAYLATSKYGAEKDATTSEQMLNSGPATGGGDYIRSVVQSTTGNATGIYDMAGGAWEYVMGSYGSSSQSSTSYFKKAAVPPYVDTYTIVKNSQCSWNTCGGDALYETAGWGSDTTAFTSDSSQWFERGGYYGDGANDGIFSTASENGNRSNACSFRVALRAS